jgi:hypothetical protein
MQKATKSILLPLLLIWLFAVIAFYYWGHQYLLIRPVISLLRSLWLIAVCLLLGLAALGLGAVLSRLLRLPYEGWGERVVYSLVLGQGAIAFLVLALGFSGLIRTTLFWIATLIIAAPTLFWLLRSRGVNREASKADVEPLERFDYLLLAFIGLILFAGLQLSLAPPIAWDGLSTHLPLVSDVLNRGALEPTELTSRPLAGHLVFVWGMALGGDILPQLISFGQGLTVIGAVWVFSRQHFGRRTAILAAAILCSVEVFIIAATWPYVDLAVGMFGLLAILSLVKWQLGETRAWLVAATILAVFAAHTKSNGLFVYPVVLLGMLIGLWWQREELKMRLVDVAVAAGTGLVIALIWTAAETVLSVRPGGDITTISNTARAAAGGVTSLTDIIGRLAIYGTVAWEMTILGQQGGLVYDGTISPFFLILTPFVVILPGKPRVVWALLVAALLVFGAWLLVPKDYYQNRHLVVAYPLFSILVAYFILRLPEFDRPWFSLSGFFRIILVVVLAIQVIFLFGWLQGINPMAYLLGLQSREQFLTRNLDPGISPGYYSAMDIINTELPEGSVVGVVQPEPRLYYCQDMCITMNFPRTATAEDMARIAGEKELTHVLVSASGLRYWLDFYKSDARQFDSWSAFMAELERFTDNYAMIEHVQDESFYLYRLQLEEPPPDQP